MIVRQLLLGIGEGVSENKKTEEVSQSTGSLGLFSLIALVVANMIGVGVFTSSGYSMATLGNPGRVMLAWGLCGIWAVSGAIAYGGLAMRLPQSGGEYLFLSRFIHPSVGFMAGWISLVAGFSTPIAIAAKNAAVHMLSGAKSEDLSVSLIAAAIIVVATLSHLAGIRIGAGTQNSIVATKLLLMLWIVIVAFFLTPTDKWMGTALPDRNPDVLPESLSAWWSLAGSMSWLALAYTGFNAAIYVAGDSKNASKLVPRSMLLGTLLVTAIYLLLNYIFVFYPSPEKLLGEGGFGEEKVAAVAMFELGGASLSNLTRLVIILSTLSSVWAMLLMGPRVYRQMALDAVFPKLFDDSSYRRTILLQCVLSVAACFAGSILDQMTYLGLTLSASGALAVVSLLWIRRSLPEAKPLTAVELTSVAVYLSMTAVLIIATSFQRHSQFIALVFTFLLGIIIFFAWHNKSRPAATN